MTNQKMRTCTSYGSRVLALVALLFVASSCAFSPAQIPQSLVTRKTHSEKGYGFARHPMSNLEDEDTVTEEVRVKILGDRRKQVRSALKAAESLRNFRLSKGRNRYLNGAARGKRQSC